ncbi:hypothetical protein DY000_02014491 [Brassica cretica]|uniref:Uncharacterized protein n=1 Tax=Brassica cretica TaxID=69181 RepID=A0ABQ7CST7_BRACR|nr:hypothetical protein DY000_02014491 [Brassica cretica]
MGLKGSEPVARIRAREGVARSRRSCNKKLRSRSYHRVLERDYGSHPSHQNHTLESQRRRSYGIRLRDRNSTIWANGSQRCNRNDPGQRIPPIGTSSQDRSPSIDQTSIPARVRARVWNRPGDRQSADDPTRSQSRPISPTPLAQTRGELTQIWGMVSTLIDEIRSQKIANQTIANRLEQAEKELADHRAANARERNQMALRR